MKTKKILSALCMSSVLVFSSCDKSSSPEEEILNSKIGVHKIEVDVQTSSELSHVAAFAGYRENAVSKLYNASGEYQGNTYLIDTNTTDSKKIVCYTDDKSVNLTMAYTLTGQATEEATVVVKSYINNKMVDKLEKNVKFTDKHSIESISISTIMSNK